MAIVESCSEEMGVVVYKTVYLEEERRLRIEARKESLGFLVFLSLQAAVVLILEYCYIPCSTSFDARPLSAGRAGKSTLMIRGLTVSPILNEPARE